ncbi:hypothetical protein V6N13_067653 [Hibiscus sabdariffa]|uniref:Uncharacterized protein n=1 Tax=Hibiscus sabdariffa TaxID=183260 RepID=A0ABR2DU25_9ROSI
MDVKPCLLVFLVINAVTLSELHFTVQAAESEPVSLQALGSKLLRSRDRILVLTLAPHIQSPNLTFSVRKMPIQRIPAQ